MPTVKKPRGNQKKSHKVDKDMAAILETQEYRNPGSPILPTHPCRCVIAGMSGSGKTHFVLKEWILSPKSPWDRVIWVAPPYSLEQEKVTKCKEAFTDLDEPNPLLQERFITIPGLTERENVEEFQRHVDEGHEAGLQQCVVLDDCIHQQKHPIAGPVISDLFTGGRHRNLTTIELVQQLFSNGSRLHRINTDHFVCFNFGDKREVKTLCQMISPNSWRKIANAYSDSTLGRGPGSYLWIDQQATRAIEPSHRLLRFRSTATEVFDELADI